jgi:hypothetical protein
VFSPAVAAELHALGHDVIAVVDQPELRSKSGEEVFAFPPVTKSWPVGASDDGTR